MKVHLKDAHLANDQLMRSSMIILYPLQTSHSMRLDPGLEPELLLYPPRLAPLQRKVVLIARLPLLELWR
jgi:hypothetical protein